MPTTLQDLKNEAETRLSKQQYLEALKLYRLVLQPDLWSVPGLAQTQSSKETVLHVDPSTTHQSILGIDPLLVETYLWPAPAERPARAQAG